MELDEPEGPSADAEPARHLACAGNRSLRREVAAWRALRIEGTIDPDLLERVIRQVVREAEPLRAAFFQVDGQVFQKVVDYPDVELARY